MKFGEKLRELREKKGLSQAQLGAEMGASQGGVGHWENGNRVPSFEAMLKLCKVLGVRCTAFEGCEFGEAEEKRGRGRPRKQ